MGRLTRETSFGETIVGILLLGIVIAEILALLSALSL